MTHTFRATPEALKQATQRTIIRFTAYYLFFAAVFLYLAYLEEWAFPAFFLQVMLGVFGLTTLIFFFALWRSRKRVKSLVIEIDGEQLKAQFGATKVNIRLDEIRRIGLSRKDYISIYLKGGRFPFMMLSPHIENKNLLLQILEERAPVEREKYSAAGYVRLLTLLLTVGAAVCLALAQDLKLAIPAAAVLLSLISWALFNIYRNRRRVRPMGSIITLLLLAAIVILKLLALSGQVQANF